MSEINKTFKFLSNIFYGSSKLVTLCYIENELKKWYMTSLRNLHKKWIIGVGHKTVVMSRANYKTLHSILGVQLCCT